MDVDEVGSRHLVSQAAVALPLQRAEDSAKNSLPFHILHSNDSYLGMERAVTSSTSDLAAVLLTTGYTSTPCTHAAMEAGTQRCEYSPVAH